MQQLVQGGTASAGGGLVIGRQRGRVFRHDVAVERGRGVAAVAGEFGAELARALRASLLPAGQGAYGSREPSELCPGTRSRSPMRGITGRVGRRRRGTGPVRHCRW